MFNIGGVEMNEREITQKLIKGDSDALEIIITEYNSYVTAIVRTILCEYKNEADIQGLVNQVFFLLWKNCQKIDFSKCDSIKYYLGAIARNTAITEKRKFMKYSPLDENIFIEDTNPYSQIELREVILSAVKELDAKSQIILLKFYFQGKTIQKIAYEECLSQTAVKSQLKRSREKLKKILERGGIVCED